MNQRKEKEEITKKENYFMNDIIETKRQKGTKRREKKVKKNKGKKKQCKMQRSKLL